MWRVGVDVAVAAVFLLRAGGRSVGWALSLATNVAETGREGIQTAHQVMAWFVHTYFSILFLL